MITHPDVAAKAALGTYQERIEQAHITHILDRAVRTRIGLAVDATGNDATTTRSTRLTRSIRLLLRLTRQPTPSGATPARSTPTPMTTNAS